ncbi:MAG: hypothetical protein RLN60_05185 [Phycisphaerales bacterium]
MSLPADPNPDALSEATALARAKRLLADNREGTVAFEGAFIPFKCIRSPKGGHLIASVPVALLMADEVIAFLPEERDDALQLLLTAEQVEESALTDRFLAYFPEPEHVRWAELWIDAGRLNEYVFDGDALMTPNALAGEEIPLLRVLNEDKGALKRACATHCTTEVAEPLAVGVDELGVDIRAHFGIVRLPFADAITDADAARAHIESILRGDA